MSAAPTPPKNRVTGELLCVGVGVGGYERMCEWKLESSLSDSEGAPVYLQGRASGGHCTRQPPQLSEIRVHFPTVRRGKGV